MRERAEEYGLRILTDDWLQYNANEAITETEGADAEELNEVDRKYKGDVSYYTGYLEDLEREGKLDRAEREDLEQVKVRRSEEIIARLLQEDIIENLGIMKTKGDVVAELVARLSKEITYPLHYLRQATEDMVSRGMLKYELHQGKVTWGWD